MFIIPNKKPQFASIGDIRIKLSNIKNYGLTSDTETYKEEIVIDKSKAERVIGTAQNVITSTSLLVNMFLGDDIFPTVGISGDRIETKLMKGNTKYYM